MTKDAKYNIKLALQNYRDLCAFIENAVDEIDYNFNVAGKISARSRAITMSHLDSTVYKAHIDNALKAYGDLCELDGNTRPYDIIMRKFIDPICGDTRNSDFVTNVAIARHFGISVDTVERDIRKALPRLKIIFFGECGMNK